MQPTVGIKNALQEGRPIPRSLPALYRGLTINAVSMAPITAVQFGANRTFEQSVQKATGVPRLGTQIVFDCVLRNPTSAVVYLGETYQSNHSSSAKTL